MRFPISIGIPPNFLSKNLDFATIALNEEWWLCSSPLNKELHLN